MRYRMSWNSRHPVVSVTRAPPFRRPRDQKKRRALGTRMGLDSLVVMASMRSMTFLQVDRCSNEPFSTYCVYCVFYKLILRILRILQIVILEYCVYCVFYKLTSAHIAYIAYVAYIALRILRNIALRCVAYFTTSQSRTLFLEILPNPSVVFGRPS